MRGTVHTRKYSLGFCITVICGRLIMVDIINIFRICFPGIVTSVLKVHFQTCSNNTVFSVPLYFHRIFKIRQIARHGSFQGHIKRNLGICGRHDHVKYDCLALARYHLWTNSYYVTSIANNVACPLILWSYPLLACRCSMIYHHDTHNQIWKKKKTI